MKKEKEFVECRFNAEVLREAIALIQEKSPTNDKDPFNMKLQIDHDDAKWDYDALEEFLADFRASKGGGILLMFKGEFELLVCFYKRYVSVSVKAPDRSTIENIFDVFERNADKCKLEPLPEPIQPFQPQNEPVVFIGHGQSNCWRDLKDHLQDKHDIKIEAYETGARAGHSIRDILDDMIKKSSFALLVLTGEDEQASGESRARQNVIHEAGLFQGRLGFSRAILLLEKDVENFSNVQGVQYIEFSKNNIKEVFGEVLATLRREFKS